jgi:hypothetical protein
MIYAIIYGSTFLIGTILLLLGRIWLRGYYFAVSDIRDEVNNGHEELKEFLLKKEKLFNFLYYTYLSLTGTYFVCVVVAIYIMVAPKP